MEDIKSGSVRNDRIQPLLVLLYQLVDSTEVNGVSSIQCMSWQPRTSHSKDKLYRATLLRRGVPISRSVSTDTIVCIGVFRPERN